MHHPSTPGPGDADVVVVGAGPAGLAVAEHLQREGVARCIIVDKGAVAEAISQYPAFMTFFSTRELLELGGMPLTIPHEKPTRREYLAYLQRFVQHHGLDVRPGMDVRDVRRVPGRQPGQPGAFEVMAHPTQAAPATPGPVTYRSRFVVLATGAWDHPQMLGIPGEDLPKVSHRYTESHRYIGRRVMVIGGRNSAVELALELYRAGAHVDLSYRRTSFDGHGLKYWLRPDIDNRLKKGEIGNHLGTVPVSIAPDHVRLRRLDDGHEYTVGNDFVLCMTGYLPDTGLLKRSGVTVDDATRCPTFDPATLESNVAGLFVAGVLLQGNMSGHVFIENSRDHGLPIAAGMRQHLRRLAPRVEAAPFGTA